MARVRRWHAQRADRLWKWPAIAGAVLLAIMLAGCASVFDAPDYWQLSEAPVQCAEPVRHASEAALRLACGYTTPNRSLNGCVAFYAAGRGVIHLGPQADECTIRHERAHCAGWRHDNRPVYARDCGPT